MKSIQIDTAKIEGLERIRLFFQYDRKVVELIKTIPGARWNPEMGCWHISTAYGPADKLNYRFREKIRFVPRNKYKTTPISEHGFPKQETLAVSLSCKDDKQIMDEFIKTLKIRNYSPKTIKTYTSQFGLFILHFCDRNVNELNGNDIREYLLYMIEKKKVSCSHENQAINAIKFYYEKILGRAPETYYIQRPRAEKKLPVVLSEEEVAEILK